MEHQEKGHKTFPLIAIIVMGLITGASIVSAVVAYHAYFNVNSDFVKLRLQAQRLMQRSLMLYGDVESIDLTQSTAVMRFRNQFVTSEDPVRLTVHITKDTQIVQESLIGINGAYVAISEAANKTIVDIAPGMRVAVLVENNLDTQVIEARVIFIGNPL